MIRYEEKHALYRMYVSEMEALCDCRLFDSEESIKKKADDYINSEQERWMNIFGRDGRLAGFLIIRKKPDFCEHADYCISQAYIDPSFRGQGLMKKRLDEYLADHHGTYALAVLKENTNAISFWDHYFLYDANYRKAKLKEPAAMEKGYILLSYKPKKTGKKP